MHRVAIPMKPTFHVLAAVFAQTMWGFHAGLEELEILFAPADGAVCLDVGKKHYQLGSASALEVVAKRLKILAVPGLRILVDDFASDNRRDEAHPERAGALMRLSFSFPKLFREMADFPRAEGVSEADATRARLALFWPVIAAVFEIKANPLRNAMSAEELTEKKRLFRDAFPEFEQGAFSVYSICGLAFEMFARGASEAEVWAFAEPWLDRWEQYRALNAERKREADCGSTAVEKHEVNGHIIAVLHSDDETKPRYVFQTDAPDLLVNVTSDGHVTFLPAFHARLKSRLESLYRELNKAEPGLWELRTNRRSSNPMIVNDRNRAPSRIGLNGLLLLMHEFLTPLTGGLHGTGSATHIDSYHRHDRRW